MHTRLDGVKLIAVKVDFKTSINTCLQNLARFLEFKHTGFAEHVDELGRNFA
jgi:hypothetical protein